MQTEQTTEMLPASRDIVWKILERTVIDSIEQDISTLKFENGAIDCVVELIEEKDVIGPVELGVIASVKAIQEQNLAKIDKLYKVVKSLELHVKQ